MQSEAEVQLHVKTQAELVPELTARVLALHSYETPEVVAVPITGGSLPYLAWVRDSTRAASAPGAK